MQWMKRIVGRSGLLALEETQAPGGPGVDWPGPPPLPFALDEARGVSSGLPIRSVALNEAHLESRRIISYNVADQRSKSFDMLRTQILQSMSQNKWQVIAVTSPTAGCGKTLTAINLALSIARQPECSALLVDMDLQKPQVARRLGIPCETGLVGLLEGQTTLPDVLIRAHAGRHHLTVLPTERPTPESSEWMASRALQSVIQDIRRDFRSSTIVLDMPPMLLGDDVIALLPQVDCVLLVTAAGMTTVAEVEECSKYLRSANVVRIAVNKIPESNKRYY
jgi:Mrp family chromosome partitioning ATPase